MPDAFSQRSVCQPPGMCQTVDQEAVMHTVEPHTTSDVVAIMQSADLLDISECRLFEIAYAAWHGQQTDEKTIEGYFATYLLHENVPFWVRHFTRVVFGLEQAGQLDPQQFGLKQSPNSPQELALGRRHALWCMLTLAPLLWFSDLWFHWLGSTA